MFNILDGSLHYGHKLVILCVLGQRPVKWDGPEAQPGGQRLHYRLENMIDYRA